MWNPSVHRCVGCRALASHACSAHNALDARTCVQPRRCWSAVSAATLATALQSTCGLLASSCTRCRWSAPSQGCRCTCVVCCAHPTRLCRLLQVVRRAAVQHGRYRGAAARAGEWWCQRDTRLLLLHLRPSGRVLQEVLTPAPVPRAPRSTHQITYGMRPDFRLRYPDHVPPAARDLISRLVTRPKTRLTAHQVRHRG